MRSLLALFVVALAVGVAAFARGVDWHAAAPFDAPSEIAVKALDAQLAAARTRNQPVWIEFAADWCAACRVLERTLRDPAVEQQAHRFVKIRIDATDQDATATILARFGVRSLPVVVFVTSTGTILTSPRVQGAINADTFLRYLRQVP